MEGMVVAFFVPVVLFLAIVAPIWLVLHYRTKSRSQDQLSYDERLELEGLSQHAGKMTDRIETLESILDAEAPGWRDRLIT